MTDSDLFQQFEVDLTNCDQEPIHIPGRIQPYGMLFVLDVELTISQVSANTTTLIGWKPEALLGTSFESLIQPTQVIELRKNFSNEDKKYTRPILLTINVDEQLKAFNGVVHRNPDGLLILELEPYSQTSNASGNFYEMVRATSASLQQTRTLVDLSQVIVDEIKIITQFDRVMVYQFDEDGHGTVIGEALEPGMEAYLGLHYPASDIPQQARRLYLLNWLRLIADVDYQPVDIIPTLNLGTHKPIDLTYSFLRSVSPIHIEYLKNMNVGATMAISLIKSGQLWGLIVCHHRGPIFVPHEVRTVCEFLGQLFSIQLGTRQESGDFEHQVDLKSAQIRCVERLSVEGNYIDSLANDDLLLMTGAQGAALCANDTIHLFGLTPDEAQTRSILHWLRENNVQDVFSTANLSKRFPQAFAFKEIAAGLLAITISRLQRDYILWFRPEETQSVFWGGDPNKPVEVSSEGDLRLTPRKSFAAWQQTVKATSLPWQASELEGATELRRAIIDVVLRNNERLAQLNAELERSNNELDAFAYVASHDLKEPLRGIHNYATFLVKDYQEVLDEEGVAKLQTLVRLTTRMEDLINLLLHFSRVGRVDMAFTEIPLQTVLDETLELLEARIKDAEVEIRIPRPLPPFVSDQLYVGQVFNNLISNAIKYNDKPHKWIEIGYLDQTPTVFYVRDNGIGIRDKHFDTIFRIFKRLHTRDEYGGGTGAGLSIAQKIIERHGGAIWVESTYTLGSTFYFTLERSPLP